MSNKNLENPKINRRDQMISFIIRVIKQLDDDKLQNIYHLIVHIK